MHLDSTTFPFSPIPDVLSKQSLSLSLWFLVFWAAERSLASAAGIDKTLGMLSGWAAHLFLPDDNARVTMIYMIVMKMTISPHPHSPKPDNRLFPAVLQCLQCLQCKLHQATRFQVSQCQLRTNFSCDLYVHSLSPFFGNFVCVTYLVGTEYLPDLPTWHTIEIGQFRNNCNVLHFIYWGTMNMCFLVCVYTYMILSELCSLLTHTVCVWARLPYLCFCASPCAGDFSAHPLHSVEQCGGAPSSQAASGWRSGAQAAPHIEAPQITAEAFYSSCKILWHS